jgi:Dyp-type peroxidase family
MTVNLDAAGIDYHDPAYRPMLARLQANILKSHGRDYSDHILLRFTATPDEARRWLQHFSQENVTSALHQLDEGEQFRDHQVPGGMIACLFLTADGYRSLDLDTERFNDQAGTFRRGMKDREFDLFSPNKDPKPERWQPAYRGAIHAMILLADDSPDTLAARTADVCASVAAVATVLGVEHGKVRRNEVLQANGKGQPIEPFGYVDGRSNPLFLKHEIDREIDDKGGIDEWDPTAPLSLALIADPFAEAPDSFGSFLVFRKLRQDVAGFDRQVADLAGVLGIDEELAGALAVGRFKDGTPVSERATDGLGDVNNFGYDDDRRARKCPFQAHIRKVNPRGGTPFITEDAERQRRIVRRGIPFDDTSESVAPSDADPSGVGLLFQCYQADIHHQFEFIMRTWADNPNFPEFLLISGLNTGDDPIIGQDKDTTQKWRTEWGVAGADKKKFNFGGWVTLEGGEYFFAPSLSFLNNLSTT